MPWIWLDPNEYPEYQKNQYNILYDCENKKSEDFKYVVVNFSKKYKYDKKLKSIKIRVSADNKYILHINGNLIGIGPASSGGDFLCTGKTPKHYADNYEIELNDDVLEFNAKVCLQPEMLTYYSRGQGGFYLSATVIFEDGSTQIIETDSSWNASPDISYCDFRNIIKNVMMHYGVFLHMK